MLTSRTIATELGKVFTGTEWTVAYTARSTDMYDNSRIRLTHSNGASVLVEEIDDMIVFTPLWPQDSIGTFHKPENPIGMVRASIAREWPTIAKEVTRRLLTMFQEQYPAVAEIVQRTNNNYDKQQQTANELAAMLGTKAESHGRPTSQFYGYHRMYRVNVNYGGETVNIELSSVKVETAQKIIELLKECEAR